MKKYNIKIFKKIKLNAVGADASVRLRKNQNRNNIRTFDKHKSDAVGVGVLDDPFYCLFLFSKMYNNILISHLTLIYL